MSVFEIIQARRSIGLMKPEVPSKEKIERILQAATYAPNHHEVEPWKFVVMVGEARKQLGDLMAAVLKEKLSETTSEKALAALQKEAHKPLRAPVIIMVGSLAPNHPKIRDIENLEATSAAVQNMLLVAEEEGLAAIWRSGDASFDPQVKAFFGLQPQEHIVAFLYLGYAAVPKPHRVPTSFEEKTEWRGWA